MIPRLLQQSALARIQINYQRHILSFTRWHGPQFKGPSAVKLTRNLSTSSTLDESNGLTYSSIANSAAEYLENFHEIVSLDVLPWGATIPLAALSLRLITLPVVYHTQLHAGRAALAATELPRIHHFVRNAPGTILQKYRTFRRLRRLTLRAAGTSSLQQFPWHISLHVPLLVVSSMGMRALASQGLEEWRTGGPPFAPDLLAADPTGVLPIMTTALWLWNIDPRTDIRRATIAADTHKSERSRIVDAFMTRVGDTFTIILRVASVVALTATMELPAGLVLFWVSNATVTAIQRLILSRGFVRTIIGLPSAADIALAQRSNLMPALEQSVENARKQLSELQQRILQTFSDRPVDDRLCADVNRMLKQERWRGRIVADLEAVIREDERDGKKYVAVVRRGTGEEL